MNRPDFKSYKYAADPRKAYSDAMKNYLVHLEENQRGETYQALVQNYAISRQLTINAEMESYELRKTLKILRSQIKTMWKENNAN